MAAEPPRTTTRKVLAGLGVVTLNEIGSRASRVGLRPRDIFVSLNVDCIDDARDLVSILVDEPGYWQLEINRDGRRLRQTIR